MDMDSKYQNILDDVLLKTSMVLLTGAKDELGCHLIIFQSHQQSLFIQLDYATLVQSICNILTYYYSPVVSLLVNFHQSSSDFIEHFIEVIHHVKKKFLKCEIKRLYIVKPEQKSIQKSLMKKLQSKSKKGLSVQVVIVKNFDELHQYVKVKNLTPEFGGVLVHDHNAWVNVQKLLSKYYLLVNEVVSLAPNVVRKMQSLASEDDRIRSSKDTTEHSLNKRLQKSENKKNALMRKFKLTRALEEGQRFRSFFQDPSLNEDFYALSKTLLLEWDRIKFHEFYRTVMNIKNTVEKSWNDVVTSLKLASREQRLYERLSECSVWIVDYGLPYLMKSHGQSSSFDAAMTQTITFENGFYQEAQEIIKSSRTTLKEVHNHEKSHDITSSSLHALADNLTLLLNNFKEKLDERMQQDKKHMTFMEVLKKAETWYEKAKDFWPSRLGPSSHRNNTYLSPSSLNDISQSEYHLELFLERYPPLTTKELRLLMEHVDEVDDLQLRNQARLLGNRCQEMEKILRARETHIVDSGSDEEDSELDSFGFSDPRLTDSCSLHESWNSSSRGRNRSYHREASDVNMHHSLPPVIPKQHGPSPSVLYSSYHRKGRMKPRNAKPKFNSTNIENDSTSVLRSTSSLPRHTQQGVALEEFRRSGNDSMKKESRLENIKKRLKDQELLYEQLIIEEELRELNDDGSEHELGFGHDEIPSNDFTSLGGSRSYLTTNNNIPGITNSEIIDDTRNNKPRGDLMNVSSINDSEDGLNHPFTSSGTVRSDASKKEVPKSTALSGFHGYPPELTSQPYDQSSCNSISVVQRQSTLGQAPSLNTSELSADVQEKLRIAREAEEHWTRVKTEQRKLLERVIYDVTKRKEIEEVYFNAQVQLCRIRRDIAMLDKPYPGFRPASFSNNSSVALITSTTRDHFLGPKTGSQDFQRQRGAFRPYVKRDVIHTVSEDLIGSYSPNYSQPERKVEGEETELVDNLENTEHGENNIEKTASSSTANAMSKKLGVASSGSESDAEEDEGNSDEFEDGEEEELMILRSDSSSGRRSQDELRDSLREEQEKLEEAFRQQKENFKKEQEKLREEEERIKEWEMTKPKQELKQQQQQNHVQHTQKQRANTRKDDSSIQHQKPTTNISSRDDFSPSSKVTPGHENGLNSEKNSGDNTISANLTEKPARHKFLSKVNQGLPSRDVAPAPREPSSKLGRDNTRGGMEGVDVGCVTMEKDVHDVIEISVSNDDSEDETRADIEEELIKILKENESTDDEASALEEREITKEGGEKITSEPGLPEIDGLDDGENIEIMNQMIDELMISDQDGTTGDHERLKIVDQTTPEHPAECGYDSSSIDVDIELDLDGDEKIIMDDGLSLMELLRRKDQDFRDQENLEEHEVDLSSPGKGKDTPNVVITNEPRVPASHEVHDQRQDNQVINGIHVTHKNDTDSTLDVRLECGPVDSSMADGLTEDTKGLYGVTGKNIGDDDLLVSTKIEDNEDASPDVTENMRELHDEDITVDVDFNIDIAENEQSIKNEPLLLADLIGRTRTTESEGSSEEEVALELAQLDAQEHAALEELQNDVNDDMVDMDISENTVILRELEDDLNNISDDPKMPSSSHREPDRTLGFPGIVRGGRRIIGDPVTDEDSDDDFGVVLEDIEEEGSEYEESTGDIDTISNKNDDGVEDPEENIPLESSTSFLRPARFTDDVINNNQEAKSSFSSSIIIDAGSGYCKAGFSVDDKPRVIIPSVVGKPKSQDLSSANYKDHYVGYDASKLHRVLALHHPVKHGVVEHWDLMEKVIDCVYDELRCESDQYPVLLSEPPLNPKKNREQIIQMMFETFHVPAAYICVQAVLSLFATGKTTGLVYDCGHDVTHSVPIYEGYGLPHATTTINLAGQELTGCLARMLTDRGVSLKTSTDLEIVQDIKEKLCYVVVDYDSERKAYNTGERADTKYRMPDGQDIVIGSERFRCPEVLFTPSIVGLSSDGIHEVIYKTVMQCELDVRSTLLKNIVLSGGSTMFAGLSRRLHVELSKLLGTRSPDGVQIEAPEERNVLTWQGGSLLSKLSNFSSMWISAQEYEEFGPSVVHRKCV